MNRIASKIMEARIASKMTQKELAKKCGLTESYILQIESGKKIINEDIAEKILKALGQTFEVMEPMKETITPQPSPLQAPKKATSNQQVAQPTAAIQPNAQWRDALAGVIRVYPIMRGQKQVGELEMVIANKKIEGVHPDMVLAVEATEAVPAFRIGVGDTLLLTKEDQLVNERLYVIEYYGKQMVRRVRKEHNGQLNISPGLSGASSEQVPAAQIKLIGRLLRVTFTVK